MKNNKYDIRINLDYYSIQLHNMLVNEIWKLCYAQPLQK